MRNHAYRARLDVHDFLDEGIIEIAGRKKFSWANEAKIFRETFANINSAKGRGAFLKNDRFSLGFYEFIALGVSRVVESNKPLDKAWLAKRIDAVSKLPEAEKYTGSGIRGTQRLSGFVLAKAEDHFRP